VILEIGCKDHRVTVDISSTAGMRKVTVNGKDVLFDWVRLPDGYYSLIVEDRVYDFLIELSEDSCTVTGREGSRTMSIFDARRPTPRREVEAGLAGLQRLKADMPGKVVRVLVKEGDSVTCDQGLLVLEAMKMQNEIRAPKSGIVREIRVVAGTAVNTGEFLLSLE